MIELFKQRWLMQRRRVVAVALLLLLALVAGVAHTPFVRAKVLSWTVSRLRDAGIVVQIGRLDYNLFALTFRFDNLAVSAEESDVAFFSADAVRVDLPWSIVRGTLAVQSFELDRPTVTIVRAEDGSLNLPRLPASQPDSESGAAGPIQIGRLAVRELGLRYGDMSMPLSVDARGVTLEMSRGQGSVIAGRLSMSDGIRLALSGQETSISTLESDLRFDGTTLSVGDLVAEAPEARLRADGTVRLLDGQQQMDMRYEGSLNSARLAPWVGLDPTPSGLVAFSGTARGPLTGPDLTLDLTGEALDWPTFGALSFEAHAGVSGSVVTLESLRASVAGGEVSGEARLRFDDAGPSTTNLTVRNLDIAVLESLAPGLPVSFASVADGTAALEWTGQDISTANMNVLVDLRAARPRPRAIALSGRVGAVLNQGAWTFSVDQQVGESVVLRGSASGRFEAGGASSSSVDGRATVEVANLSDMLRQLESAGLVSDGTLPEGLRGSFAAEIQLGGSLDAPRARGTLTATELWLDEIGPGVATMAFDATTRELALDPLRIDIGSNFVNGRVVVGLETNALTGAITATLPDLAPLTLVLPAEWRPEGSARFDALLAGTVDNPTVRVTLSSKDIRVAGQALRSLESRGRLADRVLTIDQLDLVQDGGRLTGTGSYEMGTDRFALDIAGEGLSIAPFMFAPPDGQTGATPADQVSIDAQFDVQLHADGTFASPAARGFVQFSRLDWNQYGLGTARADVVVEGGNARAAIGIPSVNATARIEMTLDDSRPFTFEAAVTDARLAELLRYSGPAGNQPPTGEEAPAPGSPNLTGTLTARANGSGRMDDLRGLTASLDIDLLDTEVAGQPFRLERPVRLRYTGQELTADDLVLHIGGSTLSARGALGRTTEGDGLSVDLVGSLADAVPFIRLIPAASDVDASGGIDLRVRASGSLDAPNFAADLSIDKGTFTIGGLPPVDATLDATYSNGLLAVSHLNGGWQGASIEASGEVPATLLSDTLPEAFLRSLPDQARTATATVRITSITEQMLAPFLDQATVNQMQGRFDAVVEATADALDLDSLRADVTLTQASMELARVPINQTRPTRMRLAAGRLDVVDWAWSGAGNRLEVFGGADLSGETPTLGLRATGSFDLRLLGAFAPDFATAGRATLDVDASGPLDDPRIEGQVTVADGNIVVREPRFAITDLEGIVTLTKDRMRLRDVTASANGGDVQISGEILYPDFALAGGTVSIAGRGLAFEIPENLRTEVNTDLEFSFSDAAPLLTGRVTILRGSYREPISLAGQILTGVDVVAVEPVEAEPGLADRIQLGVSIVSDEDILIDNNYGSLELGANLKVIGTLSQPALAGRLTMLEGGEVFLGGQTYQVVRGTIDFTNARRIEPNIDLALQTRVQNYDITLEVRGTPETLEVSLRSPGASQEDVVSLLLTGQLASGPAVAQTEIARGQLLMLLSGELLGFAGRAIGLDSAQVGRGLGGAASDFDLLATSADPGARLTLSKNLNRDVQLVFSQSLRESGAITWIAIYRPLQNLEVRGTTEDDTSRAYEFRQELNFGGGTAARTGRARRGRDEAARVSDVRLTGNPGFAETELRNSIRLAAGDRFDFQAWQQDQDRVASFYHDRDFLEVHITARRRLGGTEDARSVSLEYQIDRGPRTTLNISGYAVPDSLLNDMRIAWSRAVFDGFLLEDLEVMATGALAEEGYLQADVEAAVVSPPESETKEIAVRIAPGMRYDERRIAFSGNQHVETGVLEALLRTRGLDVTGWRDAAVIRTAIEDYYRSIGFLAADVAIAAPVFDRRSATLPVRVDEGTQFQIATVTIQGVKGRSETEVREAFGIAVDSPYLPTALEPARRQVEVGYLERGFNDARVSVTTLVDREHTHVDISLSVDEGLQQILTDVDIPKNLATSPGTIERAVDLELGEPANLTDIYRAQKRLYDTGVFQTADVTIEPVTGATVEEGIQAVRASVALQELPPYRFRYGVRLNDEVAPAEGTRQVQPALVVDLLRRNLFGRAVLTGVAGQLESDRRLARGYVSLPRFFGLPVTSTLFLTGFRNEFTRGIIENKSEVTAEQRFRPATNMAVTYGYNFARSHVFRLDPDPDFPFDITVNVARLTGTYAWDTRNDPSDAQRGWFHSSGLDYGPEAFGSDVRFIRYLAQQYYFKTIGGSVLASGFRFGMARGFGQDLIPSERFFVGGGTTVRGFAENGLGPQSFLGDALGGNSLLLLNQEVRFPMYKWLRGVGFFDAGNVFTRAADVSLTDLDAGTGVGLRISSPFALIRIDYGVPLSRRQEQPKGRWYFGLGQTF